jgi:hypothetical protein
MDMPRKKLDRDSITLATLVSRLRAMSGKAGRYMSMENGPIADNRPKMMMSRVLSFDAALVNPMGLKISVQETAKVLEIIAGYRYENRRLKPQPCLTRRRISSAMGFHSPPCHCLWQDTEEPCCIRVPLRDDSEAISTGGDTDGK